MTRLNQIIAVEKSVKSKSLQDLTEAHHALQKPALLSGISRTYRPRDEEGESLPPESTRVQLRAEDVMKKVSEYGWKQSFSYVGRPGDNAWSESFFSILKKEIVHWRFYPTRESARQAIFEYIEVFYNRRRVQKRLGYQSPINFLNAWQQLHLQSVA